MKIKIRESEEHRFTKDERKFLLLLEEDDFFEKQVQQARIILGIPPEGYDEDYRRRRLNNEIPKDEKWSMTQYQILYYLRTLYNVPRDWIIVFASIIHYGEAQAEGKDRIPSFVVEAIDDSIVIKISQKLSIRDLKKKIDERSKELKLMIDNLPEIKQIKIENIEIKKKILQLRREGKKDAAIAKILEVEYGENLPFSPEYYIISTQRSRFENNLREVLKKDYAGAKKKLKSKFKHERSNEIAT
jgi:hypothetical protein